jgi:single-stranded DNA-binding protein
MADINRVKLFGTLSAGVEIRNLKFAYETTAFSNATDTEYVNTEKTGWMSNPHWHSYSTYQPGLVRLLKQRSGRGVRGIVSGHPAYRSGHKEGEVSVRSEVKLQMGFSGAVNFVDRDRVSHE